MAVGAILTGGYGLAKTLGVKLPSLGGLFGGGEKGSGKTKRNTLAHAIDKLDKANDYEALELAPQAVQLKVSGASDLEVAAFLESKLGYAGDGLRVLQSGKWRYIKQMLNRDVEKIKSQHQTVTGNNSSNSQKRTNSPQTGMDSGASGASGTSPWKGDVTAPSSFLAGGNTLMIVIGSVLLGLIYMIAVNN